MVSDRPDGLTLQPTELQPRGRESTRLELRPISTVLERYLAELADRAGLPRPGVLASLSPIEKGPAK